MPTPTPTTPQINQPGQVPRNPASGGLSDGVFQSSPGITSRSRFLVNDYTNDNPAYWSMFMPGQDGRGSGDGPLPAVWPAAGSLLRVPKCVYLTSCPPAHLWGANFVLMTEWSPNGYFGHYNDATARDTRTYAPGYAPPTSVPLGSLAFDGLTGTYSYIGWTIDPQFDPREIGRRKWQKYATIPNPIVAEHLRLVAEFQIAKSTLEARYPDQVFVQVCDFFPLDPVTAIAPWDERMPKVLDVYTPSATNPNTPGMFANGPIWMLGPDRVVFDVVSRTYSTPFFGTNFLHIYCGFQAIQGQLIEGETFEEGPGLSVPDISDLVLRGSFDSNTGYSLNTDPSFAGVMTSWVMTDHDMYQTGTNGTLVVNSIQNYITTAYSLMTQSTLLDPGGPNERLEPEGKLDMLLLGWRNFAGYRVSLHEYDLTWSFGPPVTRFKGATTTSLYPCYSLNYDDQDWVEGYAFNYADRVSQYGSGAPWHDLCFPGANGEGYPGAAGTGGDDATGGTGPGGSFNTEADYNMSTRYPGTDQYEGPGGYNSVLKAQYDLFVAAMTNASPGCVAVWNQMIREKSLDTLGFQYDGGSSLVDSAYIIAYVEDYYGLTPPG